MTSRKETDLYLPIKTYFEEQGFEVKGEVRDCDLVAVRDDLMVIVELKTSFNLTLVLQGIKRQKSSDDVFLAVEAPKNPRREPHWNEIRLLCRRLGMGLLTVSFTRDQPCVELICSPAPYQPNRKRSNRGRIQQEFQRRSGDFNIGGRNKHPIVTAYREEAIRIAYLLKQNGPLRLREITQKVRGVKTSSILQKNFYGWFVRVEKGVYQITSQGETALQSYEQSDILIRNQLNK